MAVDRRVLAAAALATGLALSPAITVRAGPAAVVATLACALAAVAVRAGAAIVIASALAGLLLGGERLAAIEAGAYDGRPGTRAEVTGFVAAVPSISGGIARVPLDTAEGRLLVETRGAPPRLSPGQRIHAFGVLREPPDWYAATLRRRGIGRILSATRVRQVAGRRSGLSGALDRVRDRAAAALTEGMEDREGALALGFVLGQDDRIDPLTEERFRRSGLAHLLAVSGQNVLLLVLLAAPVLALLGFGLRTRLWLLIALIAVYVPLAGAGPSIQRAGVMGAAGLVALLAGRPASRAFALAAAAAVTLSLNPLAAGDPGWQLSFAAVLGIFCLAPPLRRLLGGGQGGRARGALAEGAAVTIAATLATAPLSAHHFEAFSFAALPANLLVLAAVAPAMWIGMAVAALAQIPGAPVGPLNALNEVLLGYIAQIAAWLGDPPWAQTSVGLPSPAVAAALVALILGGGAWVLRRLERRPTRDRRRVAPGRRLLAGAAAAAIAVAGLIGLRSGAAEPVPRDSLRVSVLDVGQGDAILLQPGDGAPILVDAGPPAGGADQALRELGVDRLAAVVVTHDQSDHSGGLPEVLAAARTDRLVFGAAGRALLAAARSSGARPTRVAEGGEIRSGALRLTVLWPPRELGGAGSSTDPNARSLVLLARWHGFEMLLTGDAEAESVPLDPGPVDLLKVSHHGSEDAGLAGLLARSAPSLAVVSVGAENPYGHPAPEVLETLRGGGVDVLRTDRDGTVRIEVTDGRIAVDTEA